MQCVYLAEGTSSSDVLTCSGDSRLPLDSGPPSSELLTAGAVDELVNLHKKEKCANPNWRSLRNSSEKRTFQKEWKTPCF